MTFDHKNILTSKQFTRSDLEFILKESQEMENILKTKKSCDSLAGKILATLFFEPSTRTRFSFESAMIRLGGRVINTTHVQFSSITKGETLKDTGKIISSYADVIAMRHPDRGSVAELAKGADVPVINAGDGPGEHPTQSLLDLFTIQKEVGKIDGIKIAMVGDLKFGRTVHSLTNLLSNFKDVEFFFVSPHELKMPRESIENLEEKSFKYTETEDVSEIASEADIVYSTRVQKERFDSLEEYEKLKSHYVFNKDFLKIAKKGVRIMHPLPRLDEISTDLDDLPEAAYFREAANGVPVRMALLKNVINSK